MAGEIDKGKGRVKQAAGDLTDDRELEEEGKVDEMAGKAKDMLETARNKVSDAVDAVRDRAKR